MPGWSMNSSDYCRSSRDSLHFVSYHFPPSAGSHGNHLLNLYHNVLFCFSSIKNTLYGLGGGSYFFFNLKTSIQRGNKIFYFYETLTYSEMIMLYNIFYSEACFKNMKSFLIYLSALFNKLGNTTNFFYSA